MLFIGELDYDGKGEEEMESNYRIEGIYNLTLERNNSHARRLNFTGADQVFFMLDYFNFPTYARLRYAPLLLCAL